MGDSAVWQALWSSFVLFLPRLVTSLMILVVFWIIAVAAGRLVDRLAQARHLDHSLCRFLGRAAKTSLLLFGVVTALGTLGIDVTALVAGLGLVGFALGFALKDIVSNALSGILLLLHKPFQPGDHLAVASLQGKVVEINLRYTILEAEGQTIFVPNANLFTNAVIVKKKEPLQSQDQGEA